MEFRWSSENQKLAITGADEDIYPRLGLRNRAAPVPGDPKERCCGKELYIDLDRTYNAMHGTCNRRDLEDFVGEGLRDFTGSGWSVFWHAKNMRRGYPDEAYEDGFRGVVTFGIIEFSIRPVDDPDPNVFIPGLDVSRLIIGQDDIRYIFNQILIRYPSTQEFSLSNLGGRWHAIHPKHRYSRNAVPQIPFEWRIARLSQERIVTSVHRWRHSQCTEPGLHYDRLIDMYSRFHEAQGPETQLPPPVVNPDARLVFHRKRKSRRSSTSPQPETSHKRQSQDFASSLRSGSDLSPTLGVTREMSSLAITSPDPAYGGLVAASQQPIQEYRQPDPDRGPRQRAYGDDIHESELDRSRGIGPMPGSIQYQLQQQARAGLQAMRPPVQGPPVYQSRTQTMPGIDSMLRGAPPPTTFHPPGYPLPPMSSSQYGRPPGYHGAYYQSESTAAAPQGRASPQPPYQYYPRGGSTGRGGSPFQGPGPARGGYQSGGPQAAQEQGRWPGRGGGGGGPPGLNRPREEDQGEYEEDDREEYEEDYEEDYQGEYQQDYRPGFQHGRGRGGPSRG